MGIHHPGVLKSSTQNAVRIKLVGICRRCKHYHDIDGCPDSLGKLAYDWQFKHSHCELESPGSVEFISTLREIPRNFDDRGYNQIGQGPQWLDWRHNADVKLAYGADTAITMDLSALSSSSTFTSGRESASVDNSSAKYLDIRISGTYISGTSPSSGGETRLYLITPYEDTPTWPDQFTGSDSNRSVTSSNILDTLPFVWSGTVTSSSNGTYPIVSALTLAQVLGFCPKTFSLYFTHAHGVALRTIAGNTNSLYYQPLYATVV